MKRAGLVAVVVVALALALAASARAGDLPPNYQNLTAAAKRDALWALLTQDTTSETWPSMLAMFKMLKWDMTKAFTVPSDVRPYEARVVHVVGAVAKFRMVPVSGTPYTGLLRTGTTGIMRVSTATEPSKAGWFSSASCNPAIALKFLRDGMPSFNFAAMYRMSGIEGLNVFEHPLSNHVPRNDFNLALKMLAGAFDKVSRYSGFVGLREMAQFDNRGQQEPSVKYPFALIVQPCPEFTEMLKDNTDPEIMKVIAQKVTADSALVGQPVYRLYAVSGPHFPQGDKLEHVADLVLDSEFTTSKWGDQSLFFEQELFDDDLAGMEDWRDAVDDDFMYTEGLPDKYEQHLPAWTA